LTDPEKAGTADLAAEVRAARRAPGLFVLTPAEDQGRGVVAVTGRDAPRWLDGMVTNDITRLSADGPVTGCYAALLTTKGRIVADLHVLARPDGYWLETAAEAVAPVLAQLGRYIVADDVTLEDVSESVVRLGVEGPGVGALLAELSGTPAPQLDAVPPDGWLPLELLGSEVVTARFGWTGEEAWQLFVPAADAPAVQVALLEAGFEARSGEALEVLRIEAGTPRLGPELDEEVFPDEARLESAISRTKGCYTGQEIVARLYSRGAVNHLLVGLRFDAASAPAADAPLEVGDKRTGEVTSACVSPSAGAIGLGFVRKEHAEPGTRLRCRGPDGECEATVAVLPLVAAGSGA
jgi:folate-binding protein YgfZ